jgi:hypothetical protein
VIGLCVEADEGVLVDDTRFQLFLAELAHQMCNELKELK